MATHYWISNSSTSFNTAANWSDGVAPANDDTLIFNSLGTANVEQNLSTTLTGLTIIVEQSYTGQIGVLSGNTATYLTISGGTLYVGQGTGQGAGAGSPLVMVDFGASDNNTAGTVYIFDSCSTSANTYYPPVLVRHSSTNVGVPLTTVYQSGGSIGLAALTGDTTGSNKFSLKVATPETHAPSVPAAAYIGPAATPYYIGAETGTVYSRANNAYTSVDLSGDAKLFTDGSGEHTATTVFTGASWEDRGTAGTHAGIYLAGGTYRRTNAAALTITNLDIYKGCTLDLNAAPGFNVTVSTPTLKQCAVQDVTFIFPPNFLL